MSFKYWNCCTCYFTRQNSNCLCIYVFNILNTHRRPGTRSLTPNETQNGMVGLTDQFPISPSHPAVIRSYSTWREDWIPLGFISSNYPLLPPHAVLSLPSLNFCSGSQHRPPLPHTASLLSSTSACCFPPVVTARFIPPLNHQDDSFIACSLSFCPFPTCTI